MHYLIICLTVKNTNTTKRHPTLAIFDRKERKRERERVNLREL